MHRFLVNVRLAKPHYDKPIYGGHETHTGYDNIHDNITESVLIVSSQKAVS